MPPVSRPGTQNPGGRPLSGHTLAIRDAILERLALEAA
jgi:hypothetical protein